MKSPPKQSRNINNGRFLPAIYQVILQFTNGSSRQRIRGVGGRNGGNARDPQTFRQHIQERGGGYACPLLETGSQHPVQGSGGIRLHLRQFNRRSCPSNSSLALHFGLQDSA